MKRRTTYAYKVCLAVSMLVTHVQALQREQPDQGPRRDTAYQHARHDAKPSAAAEGYVMTDDGVRLFYQKLGDGPTAVIIPGRLWLYEHFKRLADGRTLIFYDMRNRGRSDAVADGQKIGIQHDVRDVERIRQHFHLQKVSLIGYSYLGMVAALYALEHPERVERLVQLGPISLKYGTEYPEALTARDDKPVPEPAEVEKLNKLVATGYNKTHPREFCERQWSVNRMRLVGDPARVGELGGGDCQMPNEWPVNLARHFQFHLASVRALDTPRERVAKFTRPVLVIHGTKDRNVPYGSGREWALTWANARLITVRGAAHRSWVDAPGVILPAVDTFISDGWPQTAEQVKAM